LPTSVDWGEIQMKKVKKAKKHVRIKRYIAILSLMGFYACFMTKADSRIEAVLLAVMFFVLTATLLCSAAKDIKKIRKIQERRAKCYSKRLEWSMLSEG
jgi:hypothetical protein